MLPRRRPGPRGERAVSLLEVRNLTVRFPIRGRGLFARPRGAIHAVEDVSFSLERGGALGLVGESGSGKSTTARAIVGLVRPTSGSVKLDGTELTTLSERERRPWRRRVQMVFQDPTGSLDPRLTVGAIVAEPLAIQGVGTRKDRRARAAALLESVGLDATALERYPHEFSGGQRQRIGIARALALEPELLVLDEPVSALDVSVQASVVNLLAELRARLGLSYLFIAHDLAVVRHVCERVAVMYLGRIVEEGPREELFARPRHPYTQALLSAVPVPDPHAEVSRSRIVLAGDPPSPAKPPSGCAFHPRCSQRHLVSADRCQVEVPSLRTTPGSPSLSACFLESGRPSRPS
ncbi:MAG: ABC transporter ATP-binding protein [Planctomycetota bacterium]|nr:ABC transporter ATP-binding protein [Planctomycetota bacterium]